MNSQEMFVTRLRRFRTRNRVSIEEIATNLRIRPELLEGLEKNDLTGWPRGLYARAWIRAYALAVDLDPVDTVEEFCRLFPQGDRRTGGTIQGIAAIEVCRPLPFVNGKPPRLADVMAELRRLGADQSSVSGDG